MEDSKMGIIYLSGGGDQDFTVLLDSDFLKNLLGNNILFIPIAKSDDMNGYKKSLQWVIDKFSKLTKDNLNITLGVNLSEFINLSNFSAVYLGGGNTYKLLKVMKETGFWSVLCEYIKNGGVVYGASAGAVIFGQKISTYIEEKYLIENEKYGYRDVGGMGLLGDYSVLTHFHEEMEKENAEYFQENNNPIMAIPQGVAVVVKDKIGTVVGDKGISILHKDSSIKVYPPNATFVI